MKNFQLIKYWIFDLDNTLYSGKTKVFEQVDKKMSKFISNKLNVNIDEAKKDIGQVAEGIRTLEVIKNESFELNIKMPLVESLYNIIYEELTPSTLISDLVNNPHEVDVEFTY